MSRKTRRGDYEIGYGKPPRATRFQKGQSGNPRGRPTGIGSTRDILARVLGTRLAVTERGKPRYLLPLEILIRQMFKEAIRGNGKAQQQILRLVEAHEAREPEAGQGGGVLIVRGPLSPEEWLAQHGAGAIDAAASARKYPGLNEQEPSDE